MVKCRLTMIRKLEGGPEVADGQFVSLVSGAGPDGFRVANLESVHVEELGELMYAAYQGSVDYEGESLEETVREADHTLCGIYGDVIFDASFIAWKGDEAASVTVVTGYEKRFPLLAFSLTRPEYRNRGLARHLISRSMESLVRRAIPQLYLVVTEENVGALALYRKLGFEEVERFQQS